MQYSDDPGIADGPNFAGVGVRRLQRGNDELDHSASSSPVFAQPKYPAKSEWFPEQIDQPTALSHSRLSCGRFPRFAKMMNDPASFRVATPTPILRKPKYSNHMMAPAQRPFSPASESSVSPTQQNFPFFIRSDSPTVNASRFATPASKSTPVTPLTSEFSSNETKLPAEAATLHVAQPTSSPCPSPNKKPNLAVETFVRDRAGYRELRSNTPTMQPGNSSDMKNKTDSPAESNPGLLSVVEKPPTFANANQLLGEDTGTEMSSTPALPPESFSRSSMTEPRDIWDSATTSSHSLATPATSIDAQSSPPSDNYKSNSSPDAPMHQPVQTQSPAGQELRQSGLDAIDAFLWNNSGLCDASDDESMDVASHYSTFSYVTKRQTEIPGAGVPKHDIPEMPAFTAPADKSLPTAPAELSESKSDITFVPRPPSDANSEQADDDDDDLVENWIDSRLTTDVSPKAFATSNLASPSSNPLECRRCRNLIKQSKIRSADGKLSGVYHPECFHCCSCLKNLRHEVFYVLDDQPYCYQHYHEKCDTFCIQCEGGIEGIYREANSRKYHLECFTCAHVDSAGNTCATQLDEYFDFGDRPFCENHARSILESQYFNSAVPQLERHNLYSNNLHPLKRTSMLLSTDGDRVDYPAPL